MSGGGGKGGGSQVIGHKYFLGVHLIFCHQLRQIKQINVGDAVAWHGTVNGESDGQIVINQPNLWGGDSGEGGIVGSFQLEWGGAGQVDNAYLRSKQPSAGPGNRGVFGMVLARPQVSSNNPYIKSVSLLGGNWYERWHSEIEVIANGMNPAHIIVEVLCNRVWGMGLDITDLDAEGSFYSAAQTLANEGFGLNFDWSATQAIEDFIGDVINHIDAALYVDPTTGLFVLKLIRADYVVSELPVLNTSNVQKIENFAQASLDELINQVQVIYTDLSAPATQASITGQNTAVFQAQGGNSGNPQVNTYVGITNPGLAQTVLSRDIKALSTPLAKGSIYILRTVLGTLGIGDCFNLTWDPYEIVSMVVRIGNITYSTLDDNIIKLDVVQDVFDSSVSIFAPEAPTEWVTTIQPPLATPEQLLEEVPYYLAVNDIVGDNPTSLAAFTVDDTLVMMSAARPSGNSSSYRLYVGESSGSEVDVAYGSWSPFAVLGQALVVEVHTTGIPITSQTDFELAAVGDLAVIDGTEIVYITAIASDLSTFDCYRGMLDTTPKPHADGAICFVLNGYQTYDREDRVRGENAYAKVLTHTGNGDLDITLAPETGIAPLIGRQGRPYPPGYLLFNGAQYPASITGDLTVDWRHRDRLMQTASPELTQSDGGNYGPEAGTTYTVQFYDGGGVLRRTYTGITGTDQAWPTEAVDSMLVRYAPEWYDSRFKSFSFKAKDRVPLNMAPFIDTLQNLAFTPNSNASLDTIDGVPCLYVGTGGQLLSDVTSNFSLTNADNASIYFKLYLTQFQTVAASVIDCEGLYGTHQSNWQIAIYPDNSLVFVAAGPGFEDCAVTFPLPMNRWVECVLVKTGTTTQWFIDGQPCFPYTQAIVMATRTDSRLAFGGLWNNAGASPTNTGISDFRFYKGDALYSGTPPSNLNGTVRAVVTAERDGYVSAYSADFTTVRENYAFT